MRLLLLYALARPVRFFLLSTSYPCAGLFSFLCIVCAFPHSLFSLFVCVSKIINPLSGARYCPAPRRSISPKCTSFASYLQLPLSTVGKERKKERPWDRGGSLSGARLNNKTYSREGLTSLSHLLDEITHEHKKEKKKPFLRLGRSLASI